MAGMAIRQRVEGGQGLDRRAICMRLGGHHHLPWRVVSVILGPCGFFRRFKGPLIGFRRNVLKERLLYQDYG
ncbi:hypothetical protein Ndes2437B_g08958 [Nannochloris sp. 'desiccata']